jgi:hypothetical protein
MELMEVAARLKKTKGSLVGVRARGKSGARVTQGRIPLLGRTSTRGWGLRVGPCISDSGGGRWWVVTGWKADISFHPIPPIPLLEIVVHLSTVWMNGIS